MSGQAEPYRYQESIRVVRDWESGQLSDEQAFAHLEALLQAAQDAQDSVYIGQVKNNTGIIHYRECNFEQALGLFKQAREIFEQVGSFDRAAGALMNSGTIMDMLGQRENARQAFRDAFNVAVKSSAYYIQSLALLNEAYVFLRTRRFEHAQMLASQADHCMKTFLETEDQNRIYPYIAFSQIHQVIALCDGESKQVKAWDSLRHALSLAQKSESVITLAQTTFIAGQLGYLLGALPADFPKPADDYCREGIEQLKQANAESELSRVYMSYARHLLEVGKNAQACEQIKQAIVLFQKSKMVADLMEAQMILVKHTPKER